MQSPVPSMTRLVKGLRKGEPPPQNLMPMLDKCVVAICFENMAFQKSSRARIAFRSNSRCGTRHKRASSLTINKDMKNGLVLRLEKYEPLVQASTKEQGTCVRGKEPP